MKAVIPPRKDCNEIREYDQYLYRHRHLVENAFAELKKGKELPHTMPKRQNHFLRQFIYGVLPSGPRFIDDTT